MKLSIIIPAYNEGKRIEKTLKDYLGYRWKCPIELLIVLNGCTDNTLDIVKKFSKKDPRIKYKNLEEASKGSALITGFIIVIIVGAFSTGINSRVPLASLDPITLKAEAEAIDIQIQLTTLGYENPLQVINDTSTSSGLTVKKSAKSVALIQIDKEKIEEVKTAESEPELTIEEALETLAQ